MHHPSELLKSNEDKEKQNTQNSMMNIVTKCSKAINKSKDKLIDTQESSKSLSKFGNPSHKRTKSYNLNNFNKPNQSIDSKSSVQFIISKCENIHKNDAKMKRK